MDGAEIGAYFEEVECNELGYVICERDYGKSKNWYTTFALLCIY